MPLARISKGWQGTLVAIRSVVTATRGGSEICQDANNGRHASAGTGLELAAAGPEHP